MGRTSSISESADDKPAEESTGLTAALANSTLEWGSTQAAAPVGRAARTPGVRIVHRTNLWADVIRASFDEDTDSYVIWTQVVPGGAGLHAYHSSSGAGLHGRRSVSVRPEHLTAESDGLWSLFRMGHDVVSNPSSKEAGPLDHRVWKFILVPHGVETRRGTRRGWTLEGDVRSRHLIADLSRLLGDYFDSSKETQFQRRSYTEHVHVAVQLATLQT